MSQEKIRLLLSELQQELARAEEVDDETLALVRRLDENIDEFIESAEQRNSPVLDDAIALEARFASNHPVAERLLRELVDNLARIGI